MEFNENFTAICERKKTMDDSLYAFSKTDIGNFLLEGYYPYPNLVFEDLITGKKIYRDCRPDEDKHGSCLHYREFRRISPEQALSMIEKFTQEQLDEYKMEINNLENHAILKHKEWLVYEKEQKKDKGFDANFVK